jgi:TniQ
VKALRVTVPLGDGETPASYASRLAAANGLPAREFCLDWDVRFQSIVDGDASAVAKIAQKGGVDASELMAYAFVRGKGLKFEHRGEILTRLLMRRKTVAVCPVCLQADIAKADCKPHLAPYGRAIWQIDAIKTCPVHKVALAVVADDVTPSSLHDWAYYIRPALGRLECLAANAERRQLSAFERYVLARLDRGPGGAPLLDGLELYVAIRTCELLGAVARFGRKANLKTLSDDQWREAGDSGFAIASPGKARVFELLGDLQRTYARPRSGNQGPQAVLGRIYQILEFGAEDPAFDPVRAVIGEFISSSFPLGPGDTVFGQPVEARRLHSVWTLSRETGLHPKRLRKLLRAAKLVGDEQADGVDNNTVFDAEQGRSAISAAIGAMSLPKAGAYVNAPRVHRQLLVEAGLLTPHLPARAFGAVNKFAVDDLDEFLRRLTADARPVNKPRAGQVSLPSAAKRACCSAAEIVRMIFDRKLAWIGRLTSERGYLSVLVDVDEVREKTRGREHGGLTLREASIRMSTNDNVVRALIKAGHLRTFTTVNPINRCPQVAIQPEEIERFQKEYVSLFVLAAEKRRHFRRLKQELDASGIRPAFDPRMIGASFYRRKAPMASSHEKLRFRTCKRRP